MRLLLDTHLVLWAAIEPARLSDRLRARLTDPANALVASAATIWEVAIKTSLGKPGFDVDPRVLRPGLLAQGWEELPVTGAQVAAVADLPPVHRDPFDRLLVAQAMVEGLTLLTRDALVGRYPGNVEVVS